MSPILGSLLASFRSSYSALGARLLHSRLTLARQALLRALDAGDEVAVSRLIPRCRGLNWVDHCSRSSWLSFAPLQKLLLANLDFQVSHRLLRLLLEAGADPLMVCPSWQVKQLIAPSFHLDHSGVYRAECAKLRPGDPDWRLAFAFALRADPIQADHASVDATGGSFIPSPVFFTNQSLSILALLQEFCSQNIYQMRIDSYGCTLLHYAVLGQDPQVVKQLLQAGADLALPNDFLETPADIVKHPAILSAIRAWELSCALPPAPLGNPNPGLARARRL